MSSSFELDRKGGEDVLKRLVAPLVDQKTRELAAAAGNEAEMDTYVTDRAAGLVSVPAHQQARDGVLTRAAASVGLEVHQK